MALVLGFQYNLLSSPLSDYYLHKYRRTYLNTDTYTFKSRHVLKVSHRKFLTIILYSTANF